MHERVVQQGHHGHTEVVGQRRDVGDTPRVLVLHLRGAAESVLPRAGRGDGAIEVIGRGKANGSLHWQQADLVWLYRMKGLPSDFALGNDAALVNRLLSPPAKEGSAH